MIDKAVVTVKIYHVKRSLDRLKDKQGIGQKEFLADRDIQDIVLLNLQTAIQGCVDIAGHIISDNGWGVPGSLAGLFDILSEKKVITEEMKNIMRRMAGFRNLIVHEYAEIDMDRVYSVWTGRLGDFAGFLKEVSLYAQL
ncbi:MAG: DUF86 domain-containing protein [Deltaproteobacteria bacterium]